MHEDRNIKLFLLVCEQCRYMWYSRKQNTERCIYCKSQSVRPATEKEKRKEVENEKQKNG